MVDWSDNVLWFSLSYFPPLRVQLTKCIDERTLNLFLSPKPAHNRAFSNNALFKGFTDIAWK